MGKMSQMHADSTPERARSTENEIQYLRHVIAELAQVSIEIDRALNPKTGRQCSSVTMQEMSPLAEHARAVLARHGLKAKNAIQPTEDEVAEYLSASTAEFSQDEEKEPWHVDGNLVYQLTGHGRHRRNRLWFSIYADRECGPGEAADLAARIAGMLNVEQEVRADG